MSRTRITLLLVGLLLASACRIEDRTPTGTRRDEDAIRAVLATYYRSIADGNGAAAREVFWDSATVQLQPAGATDSWDSFRGVEPFLGVLALEYAGPGVEVSGARMTRVDLRQQGDVAAAWVAARLEARDAEGEDERERMDHVVLRRIGGQWRIVNLVSVPGGRSRRP